MVKGCELHRGCARGSRQLGVFGEGRGFGSGRPSCKPFGPGTGLLAVGLVHCAMALLGSGLSRPDGVLGPWSGLLRPDQPDRLVMGRK